MSSATCSPDTQTPTAGLCATRFGPPEPIGSRTNVIRVKGDPRPPTSGPACTSCPPALAPRSRGSRDHTVLTGQAKGSVISNRGVPVKESYSPAHHNTNRSLSLPGSGSSCLQGDLGAEASTHHGRGMMGAPSPHRWAVSSGFFGGGCASPSFRRSQDRGPRLCHRAQDLSANFTGTTTSYADLWHLLLGCTKVI